MSRRNDIHTVVVGELINVEWKQMMAASTGRSPKSLYVVVRINGSPQLIYRIVVKGSTVHESTNLELAVMIYNAIDTNVENLT